MSVLVLIVGIVPLADFAGMVSRRNLPGAFALGDFVVGFALGHLERVILDDRDRLLALDGSAFVDFHQDDAAVIDGQFVVVFDLRRHVLLGMDEDQFRVGLIVEGQLVEFGGSRIIHGLNGLVSGALDDSGMRAASIERAKISGFTFSGEEKNR